MGPGYFLANFIITASNARVYASSVGNDAIGWPVGCVIKQLTARQRVATVPRC